jgi:hypothetical protein
LLVLTNSFGGIATELLTRFTHQEMRHQVKKASHDLNLSWEKFSSCQNTTNLQEVCVFVLFISLVENPAIFRTTRTHFESTNDKAR